MKGGGVGESQVCRHTTVNLNSSGRMLLVMRPGAALKLQCERVHLLHTFAHFPEVASEWKLGMALERDTNTQMSPALLSSPTPLKARLLQRLKSPRPENPPSLRLESPKIAPSQKPQHLFLNSQNLGSCQSRHHRYGKSSKGLMKDLKYPACN